MFETGIIVLLVLTVAVGAYIWGYARAAKKYDKEEESDNHPFLLGWPEVQYHGGCYGCTSQKEHGLEYCEGCQYKEPNWDLPNLHSDPNKR